MAISGAEEINKTLSISTSVMASMHKKARSVYILTHRPVDKLHICVINICTSHSLNQQTE